MLIAGNWKMNGSQEHVSALIEGLKNYHSNEVELLVLPPYVYLSQVASSLKDSTVRWGAQDVSVAQSGAFTGEVSAAMLRDQGCQYVTVGHSERRQYHQESNELVAKKFVQALQHQLIPILCVGETALDRDAGQTEIVVLEQVAAALAVLPPKTGPFVVAYEPVWAIGSGQSATPEQAQAVHQTIRQHLNNYAPQLGRSTKILYGGSVKVDNALDLFSQPDIDGALVGGASLQADGFLGIASAAQASVVAAN